MAPVWRIIKSGIGRVYNFNISNQQPQDYPRVRLGNITALLGSLITLLYGLTYLFILGHRITGFILSAVSLFYLLYYPAFRRIGFFIAVKCYLSFFLIHILTITILISSARLGFHLYFLLISPTAYLLLKKEECPYFPFIISLFSFFFLIAVYLLGDRFLLYSYNDIIDRYLLLSSYFFLATMLFLITSFYRLELKRRDDNTRDYMDKLNLAMSVSGVSFWEWDVEKQYFLLDDTGMEFMGLKLDKALLYKNLWLTRLHPDDFHRIIKDYRRACLKDGETFTFDYRFRKGENEWIWISSIGYVKERNEEGKAIRFLGIHRDTTQEKELGIKRENIIAELKEALESIKTLSGMLPICSCCKNIRDDKGYWKKLETYIQQHSSAIFSHSICPDCLQKFYPEEYEQIKEKKAKYL